MKSAIVLFSLLISAQTFASGKIPCKSEAELAIYERYTFETPEALISLSSQSYITGEETVFESIVTDLETGKQTVMYAVLDVKTCKVKAVN